MMRRRVITTLGSAAILFTCSNAVLADGHMEAEEGPSFFPVEMWTCSFRDRQDRGDLDRAINRWTDWMDETGQTGYAAWLITPHYFNSDIKFDVGWLGAWTDFKTMGTGHDQYLGGAQDIQDAFEKVLDCDTHIGVWAVAVAPPMGPPEKNGVVNFSSCKVAEGSTAENAYAAHVKWSKWLRGMGSKLNQWAFFPGLGSGKWDNDYYAVTGYNNNAEMGATMQMVSDNEGWKKAAELFGGVAECDGARSYGSELLFNGFPDN